MGFVKVELSTRCTHIYLMARSLGCICWSGGDEEVAKATEEEENDEDDKVNAVNRATGCCSLLDSSVMTIKCTDAVVNDYLSNDDEETIAKDSTLPSRFSRDSRQHLVGEMELDRPHSVPESWCSSLTCSFKPTWTTMSFACGGWLQFYEFGIVYMIILLPNVSYFSMPSRASSIFSFLSFFSSSTFQWISDSGVAKALQEQGLTRGVQYAGCSAGALTAVGLILGGDFDYAIELCKGTCMQPFHDYICTE